MAPQDLLNKLHHEPFEAFRVRLSNNTGIDVLDRGSVALAHMAEFIDPNDKSKGSRLGKG